MALVLTSVPLVLQTQLTAYSATGSIEMFLMVANARRDISMWALLIVNHATRDALNALTTPLTVWHVMV